MRFLLALLLLVSSRPAQAGFCRDILNQFFRRIVSRTHLGSGENGSVDLVDYSNGTKKVIKSYGYDSEYARDIEVRSSRYLQAVTKGVVGLRVARFKKAFSLTRTLAEVEYIEGRPLQKPYSTESLLEDAAVSAQYHKILEEIVLSVVNDPKFEYFTFENQYNQAISLNRTQLKDGLPADLKAKIGSNRIFLHVKRRGENELYSVFLKPTNFVLTAAGDLGIIDPY